MLIYLISVKNRAFQNTDPVSKEWIRESTTAYSIVTDQFGYGYMWAVSLTENSYGHGGHGGHLLTIIPNMDLVIVHRVNTDIGHSVKDEELDILLRMILDAKKKIILPAVIFLLNLIIERGEQ